MTKTKSISPRVKGKAPARKLEALTESGEAAASTVQESDRLLRRDGLVLQHVGLVKAIAKNVHAKLPVNVDLDDLVQAGMMGLFDAANKFDAGRQDVFSTYAKHRIKGSILDSLRQLDWASRDMRRRYKQVDAAKYELTAALLRAPTDAELAEKLGMNMDRWHATMLDLENIGPVSADSRADYGDDLPTIEFPAKRESQPDFICVQKELRTTLGQAIRTLPKRYQQVVQQYYAGDRTMKEIGGTLAINESRVSQIHKRALEMMATVLCSHGINSIHAFQN